MENSTFTGKLRKKKFFDKKLLFYCCLIALPILQFCIFYIYLNFNSLVLAFTQKNLVTGETKFIFFDNFKLVFFEFFKGDEARFFKTRAINSLLTYGLSLIFSMGFAILFSYYIYKKQFGSNFFKVMLFLPHIIPGIAMVSIYHYFMDAGFLTICHKIGIQIDSFFLTKGKAYPTVLFLNLYMSYGTNVVMYLGAMANINPSVTEAAKLDGVSFMRELWSITIPCIYPTIVTFFVVGLTGVFTNDLGLYSFFAANAPNEAQTLGYYLFRLTQSNTTNEAQWPFISAVGLVFTFIVAPITIVLKNFLDKRDPISR